MDEYELLPHNEIENLRKEVERLKKSPYPDSSQNKTLLDSMDTLTNSINKLIKIFEDAQSDIIREYSEASPTKVLKEISDQNKQIAEGILAVANLVKRSNETKKPADPFEQKVPERPSSPPQVHSNPDVQFKKERRKGLINSFEKWI